MGKDVYHYLPKPPSRARDQAEFIRISFDSLVNYVPSIRKICDVNLFQKIKIKRSLKGSVHSSSVVPNSAKAEAMHGPTDEQIKKLWFVYIIECPCNKKEQAQMGVVAHVFNPSTQEAKTGESLSLRQAYSTKLVPRQSEWLHKETFSLNPPPSQKWGECEKWDSP